jgi:hypothetical protein
MDAGIRPVKVNTVIQRGVNDARLEELAGWGREAGVTVRFIEFMDVGTTNGWLRDRVVPAAEVVRRLAARWPLAPVVPAAPGEVAQRYRYLDGAGEVGVISSVTAPFCGACTRGRLSAVGELYTCLFSAGGTDLRALLRDGTDDDELTARIGAVWGARRDRASELRSDAGSPARGWRCPTSAADHRGCPPPLTLPGGRVPRRGSGRRRGRSRAPDGVCGHARSVTILTPTSRSAHASSRDAHVSPVSGGPGEHGRCRFPTVCLAPRRQWEPPVGSPARWVRQVAVRPAVGSPPDERDPSFPREPTDAARLSPARAGSGPPGCAFVCTASRRPRSRVAVCGGRSRESAT